MPSLTVRPALQRPLLAGFMSCYVVGLARALGGADRTLPWLWMTSCRLGMATFPMVLTLIGLRARTPETTAALSTFVQGWGYVARRRRPAAGRRAARASPAATTAMFVLVLAGSSRWPAARLAGHPPALRRRRGARLDASDGEHCDDVLEAAGTEAPVSLHVTRGRRVSARVKLRNDRDGVGPRWSW